MTEHAGTALQRIDFDEMRDIARLAGFDICSATGACRSCGPGRAYLMRDKRFYLSRLVVFLRQQKQQGALEPRIARWLRTAERALQEYRTVEERLGRLRCSD